MVSNVGTTLGSGQWGGQTIKKDKPFTIKVQLSKLATGFFSDAATDHLEIPQTLNDDGIIQGHSHITIQKIDRTKMPDARVVAFYKELQDVGNKGMLSVDVDTGLPQVGVHRICTMNASNSHQPVVMPVEQRGAQDDCIRITVE